MGKPRSKRYEYTKDVFVNSRLYMGKYADMNDPMEAFYNGNLLTMTEISDIRNGKPNLRMCCLSRTYSDILMWAYYADSHKGICVEVEVNDTNAKKCTVEYDKHLYQPQNHSTTTIYEIMSHKLQPWRNEQEIRYLRNLNYGDDSIQFLDVRINRVFVGCLLSKTDVIIYQKRIKRWLKQNGYANVPIIQVQRGDLTYWNGRNRSPLF